MNEWLLSITCFDTRKRKEWHPQLEKVKEFLLDITQTNRNKERTDLKDAFLVWSRSTPSCLRWEVLVSGRWGKYLDFISVCKTNCKISVCKRWKCNEPRYRALSLPCYFIAMGSFHGLDGPSISAAVQARLAGPALAPWKEFWCGAGISFCDQLQTQTWLFSSFSSVRL